MARTLLPAVEFTEDEQEHLFTPTHKGSHSVRVITRAHPVRARQGGWSNGQVCTALEVTVLTVLKARWRLTDRGLGAVLGELPRPGQRPKLDAKQVALITALACSTAPDGRDHWT